MSKGLIVFILIVSQSFLSYAGESLVKDQWVLGVLVENLWH